MSNRIVHGLLLLCLGLLCCHPGTAGAESAWVWSGERTVSGKFRVPAGQTLLILPGSDIRFGSGPNDEPGELLIQGTLLAQGRPDAPILFSFAEAGGAVPGRGVRLATDREQAISRLEWARISGAQAGLTGRSGQILANDVEFSDNQVGIDIRGDLGGGGYHCRLTRNQVGLRFMAGGRWAFSQAEIFANTSGGVLCQGSSPTIRHCQLRDNADYAIACAQSAHPELLDNQVSGSKIGIFVDRASSPLVRGNRISDNQTGIKLTRLVFPEITHNLFEHNQVALFCNLGGYPVLRRNSFVDNPQAVVLGEYQSTTGARLGPQVEFQPAGASPRQQAPTVLLPEDGVIDARDNWWGPAALQELERQVTNLSFIDDGYDRPDVSFRGKTMPRDRLNLHPWLKVPPTEQLPETPPLTGLSGHLVAGDRPLVGARVHIHAQPASCGQGPGAVFSAPTGKDGAFVLRLRPGTYWLLIELGGGLQPGTGRCLQPVEETVRVAERGMTTVRLHLSAP